MDKKDFTAILQVALWRNDGMDELKMRQLLVEFGSNDVIKEGMELCDRLNAMEIKGIKS